MNQTNSKPGIKTAIEAIPIAALLYTFYCIMFNYGFFSNIDTSWLGLFSLDEHLSFTFIIFPFVLVSYFYWVDSLNYIIFENLSTKRIIADFVIYTIIYSFISYLTSIFFMDSTFNSIKFSVYLVLFSLLATLYGLASFKNNIEEARDRFSRVVFVAGLSFNLFFVSGLTYSQYLIAGKEMNAIINGRSVKIIRLAQSGVIFKGLPEEIEFIPSSQINSLELIKPKEHKVCYNLYQLRRIDCK